MSVHGTTLVSADRDLGIDFMAGLPAAPHVERPSTFAFMVSRIGSLTWQRLALLLSLDRVVRSGSSANTVTESLDGALVAQFADVLTRDIWKALQHLSVAFQDVSVMLQPPPSLRVKMARDATSGHGELSIVADQLPAWKSLWRAKVREREEQSEFVFAATVRSGSRRSSMDVIVSALIALNHSPSILKATNAFLIQCTRQLRLRGDHSVTLDPLLIGNCGDLTRESFDAMRMYCPGLSVRPRDGIPHRSLSRGSETATDEEAEYTVPVPSARRAASQVPAVIIVTQRDIDAFVGRRQPAAPPALLYRDDVGIDRDLPIPVSATVTVDNFETDYYDESPQRRAPQPISFHYTGLRNHPQRDSDFALPHASVRRIGTATPSW